MKNLGFATNGELTKLFDLSIGRAFRLCALGDDNGAMKAKRDALKVIDEINYRVDENDLVTGELIDSKKSIQGRYYASDKEIGLGFY